MTVKIGVLVPASRMFPRVDRDFMTGLQGALREDGIDHELVIEPVGNCAIKDIVVERVQRLLLLHRPHVVTGIMGSGMLPHVHAMFRDHEVPFIVNNIGAEPLRIGEERNPFLFHNSLNVWQSVYALGYWAARNIGPKACIASAFHEAGYDMIRAFWQGMEQGGGTVVCTEVTHRASAIDDPSAQLARLAEQAPDFMAAFYSGREGISFINARHALGLEDLPVVATPMMMHGSWLPQMGRHALGIRTAFSWDHTAQPDDHGRFQRAVQLAEHEDPAAFKLLGYETGRLIGGLAAAAHDGPAYAAALPGTSFASPRGTMHVNATTGDVETVDYLLELRNGGQDGVRATPVATLELPATCMQHREAYKLEPVRAGWLNPYLVN